MSKKENIDHISFSQIQCFKCPFRYKKIYIDKSINRESIYMVSGRIIHDAIRMYSKECISNKVESDFEIMNDVIKEALSKEKVTSEQSIEIREALLNFAELSLNYNIVLDYERKFDIPIIEGVVEGIIDRTNSFRDQTGDRCLDILDYKYSYRNYTEVEVDDSLQLRIYRWAALKAIYKNYDVIRLGIYNVRYNFIRYGKPEKVESLVKEMDSIENFLNEEWNKIKKCVEYPAIKSDQCLAFGGCSILISGECPAFSKTEIKKMLASEDIIDQVRAVRKLKIDIKKHEDSLKEYFKNNQPIVVDGDTVGFTSSVSLKYFISGLETLDKKYILNYKGLTVSKTDVEKIVKKKFGKDFEKYLDEIKEHTEKKSTNKFEI